MNDNTLLLTINEIKEIYRAGVRRGEHEECACRWGSRAIGDHYDELVGTIHEIVNKGKDFWEDPDYITWDTIESWFKESK
ncbi:hypothetical protein UFOVP132_2 [uncultured Caudovirales phage]|uniref:Uncharacterized protein n=1 Tax=uncultured Caudovirales phage TaxID=2100421 RepID=A0A6J5LBC2_9CAUD|nr:hypothetical protein UFOVP132_2 [uncultured Caudovirales phage]